MYPGSTPEFRWVEKTDGAICLQVRYINTVAGYTGKWQDIPTVKENDEQSVSKA